MRATDRLAQCVRDNVRLLFELMLGLLNVLVGDLPTRP